MYEFHQKQQIQTWSKMSHIASLLEPVHLITW